MKINGVIQKKLAIMDERVSWLETRFASESFEAFRSSWELQAAAERGLQIAIEVVIDVAERLLALHGRGPVASAAEAIRKCVELGVLDSEEPFTAMIGFRNFIVHQYDAIDSRITFDILQHHLGAFRHFRDCIDRWKPEASGRRSESEREE